MDRSEKEALVAECRASGMTAKAWCELKGIKYRYYVECASRINKEHPLHSSEDCQWADVTFPKTDRVSREVKLLCGKWTICVETGFSPALLSEVLKVMDSLC
ncbi:IS66 family insertion sequence element accessory protein TnpA [Desulfitobacterium sp. AusDCA]|uniref:IS66 family insertion sequence element accessory protein TnpA n=1 Tax=Desulfitobacterium sp. AusDCA TaxID=3240383 RepID=UPI003DA6FB8F